MPGAEPDCLDLHLLRGFSEAGSPKRLQHTWPATACQDQINPINEKKTTMTTQVIPQEKTAKENQTAKAPQDRIRIAPNTVAYVENHNLVMEFAIPGAPTETIEIKMLEDAVYLTAPARDVEYAAALPFGWPVKPGKAEASYEHGLLRISVPLKDPMEGAVKVVVKSGGVEPAIDSAKNKAA